MLDAAAVEGEHFHLGGVLALVDDLQAVDGSRSLDALVARELLLPAPTEIAGEQAWRFRHALVRDAAYESTPKSTRARGHERVADWLASLGPRVPEADARIGTHLERAHRAAVELGRAATGARSARHPRRAAPHRGRQPRAPPRRPSERDRVPLPRRRTAGPRRPGARRAAAGGGRRPVRGRLAGPRGGGGGRGAGRRRAPRPGARALASRRRARAPARVPQSRGGGAGCLAGGRSAVR